MLVSGLVSTETFGTPVLTTGEVFINPVGIVSSENIGAHVVLGGAFYSEPPKYYFTVYITPDMVVTVGVARTKNMRLKGIVQDTIYEVGR